MDGNTTFTIAIAAFCALWAVEAIARAWASRGRKSTCNCQCQKPTTDK